MNKIETGGPAFPVSDPFAVKGPDNEADALRLQQGMTLRDYFAGKALSGLVASCTNGQELTNNLAVKWCYGIADAMLEARK